MTTKPESMNDTDTPVEDEPAPARPRPRPRPRVDDDAAPATTSAPKSSAAPDRPGGRMVLTATVVASLALAFAVVAGVLWWRADHDSGTGTAQARDDVALAARVDVATLNSLDYRHVATGLAKWQGVTTGDLRTQIGKTPAAQRNDIAAAKTITTATVVYVAVLDLDASAGKATVIAAVHITKTPISGQSVVDPERYKATLTKVGGSWKVSSLSVVAAGLS